MHYNDNGVVRKIKKLHYNDNGTVRTVKKAWYNDNGNVRLVFSAGETFTIQQGRLVSGGTFTGYAAIGVLTPNPQEPEELGTINPAVYEGRLIKQALFWTYAPANLRRFRLSMFGAEGKSLSVQPEGVSAAFTMRPQYVPVTGYTHYERTMQRPAVWDGSGAVTLTIAEA